MEDLTTETSVVSCRDLAGPLESLRDAQLLAARVERAVQHETGRGVRNLNVQVGRERVVLTGFCSTYYCKQLAQHAAMNVASTANVINSIEVC
ncbi:MAG: BON domain-containing protein [Candidatus Nealsonbacteria bacterium]|nr:BON domain-containing protein [Candidatus Nealsonbacteria bacterium]